MSKYHFSSSPAEPASYAHNGLIDVLPSKYVRFRNPIPRVSPCSGCETGHPSPPFAFRSATAFNAPVRPAPGRTLRHFAASRQTPTANGLTPCRMRFACRLRKLRDLRPLRNRGDTLAPTATGDYAPRASHFHGAQRTPLPTSRRNLAHKQGAIYEENQRIN